MKLQIARLQPQDEEQARDLILAGMKEHWGVLDSSKNPDLNNIARSYADGLFLVARAQGQLIATGAFRPVDANTVEIVRMSVHRAWRRQGVGRQMLDALCQRARERGYQRAILETTATWAGVIAFYRAYGFRITHQQEGDVYFEMHLAAD